MCCRGLPFNYLGLPLNINKRKMEDVAPVPQRIDRILAGCSTLLSEKLVLIRSVFTSFISYFMSTLTMPCGILEHINKYIRHRFWGKYGIGDRCSAMIEWK